MADSLVKDDPEGQGHPDESARTTADLAHPGTAEQTAVYPGDATGDRDEGQSGGEEDQDEPLLGRREAEEYRTSWSEIQGRFVDDPQDVVKSADSWSPR